MTRDGTVGRTPGTIDGSFLARMAASSRERVRQARALVPEGELAQRARAAPPPPPLTLSDFDLIAELKLRSPAAGGLASGDFDRCGQLAAYAAGGAAAISVLTEPTEFHGELAHLEEAAAALPALPVMRKDFLTDPYQVLEARAAGAGGVLIIVAMLDDALVSELLACTREHGMFALLEAFDRSDLERIGALAAPGSAGVLAGLNCRDLKDLSVDFARFQALAPHLPPGLPAVAESGVSSTRQVRTVAAAGYRLALVGSALMGASDPAAQVAALIADGRAERAASAGAAAEQPA